MSWDVSITKFKEPCTCFDDLLNEENQVPLGTREEVHNAVSKHFNGTDWSAPDWGRFDSEHGSIEFNLGLKEEPESLMLHVRASENVIGSILALSKEMNWTAVDCQTGDFLGKQEGSKSLDEWHEFRNQISDETP